MGLTEGSQASGKTECGGRTGRWGKGPHRRGDGGLFWRNRRVRLTEMTMAAPAMRRAVWGTVGLPAAMVMG